MDGQQELGVAAAQLLEKVERIYGEDARIVDALVLAEIEFTHPDDEEPYERAAIEWHCTSPRSVVREGLLMTGIKANSFENEPGPDYDGEDD